MAAASARAGLLKHLRVRPAVSGLRTILHRSVVPSMTNVFHRFFSEEIKGTFLDKSEVSDRVISVVKAFEKIEPSKVTPKAHFQNDLGLDSLDSVEIVMAFEEEFGFEIPDNEADKITSIELAVDFIASHPQAK
ncbi:Acyl Carrier Protein (mitochondrial) [Zostera marina]|uniref:Acyl carrier protein n=1 Tax=Zostera marina TaxID=29655 RepID=A0A0K9P334_ZOSMR|nr:Acyl Carrier Protein (mitochondrial) [Zostera marina]